MAFVYSELNDQAHKTLTDLINNIPDAVILLEPVYVPPNFEAHCEGVRIGEVGATFYEMVYSNQRADSIFDRKLSMLERNLKQVDITTGIIQTSENSESMQSEDFD